VVVVRLWFGGDSDNLSTSREERFGKLIMFDVLFRNALGHRRTMAFNDVA
jgi:hypothetical protein